MYYCLKHPRNNAVVICTCPFKKKLLKQEFTYSQYLSTKVGHPAMLSLLTFLNITTFTFSSQRSTLNHKLHHFKT